MWALGRDGPSFVVGSLGVEFAIVAYWLSSGVVQLSKRFPSPGLVDKIVAISGSAALMTASQIQDAFDSGFAGIRLDGTGLIDPQTADAVRDGAVHQALAALGAGESVILYSSQIEPRRHLGRSSDHDAPTFSGLSAN